MTTSSAADAHEAGEASTKQAGETPATRWGDREARRADIVRSATQLLIERGLAGLSMRGVAEGAGVSLGAVYTYFGSKEELFADLYVERLAVLAADVAHDLGAAKDLESVIVSGIENYLDVYRAFGREVDVWTLLIASDSRKALPEELVERLMSGAINIFSVLEASITRIEPRFASASGEQRQHAIQMIWAHVTGLAQQLTGARQAVFASNQRGLIEFSARVLVAGLRAVLADSASPSDDKDS